MCIRDRVYAEVAVPIAPTSTAAELRTELSARGAELLIDTLGSGLTDPRPQSGTTTYATKITGDDLELRFDEAPAIELDRRVRVGGAWTTPRGGRLKGGGGGGGRPPPPHSTPHALSHTSLVLTPTT